jgi:hypothetical protein
MVAQHPHIVVAAVVVTIIIIIPQSCGAIAGGI